MHYNKLDVKRILLKIQKGLHEISSIQMKNREMAPSAAHITYYINSVTSI